MNCWKAMQMSQHRMILRTPRVCYTGANGCKLVDFMLDGSVIVHFNHVENRGWRGNALWNYQVWSNRKDSDLHACKLYQLFKK